MLARERTLNLDCNAHIHRMQAATGWAVVTRKALPLEASMLRIGDCAACLAEGLPQKTNNRDRDRDSDRDIDRNRLTVKR